MRIAGARVAFGFVEPAVPVAERRQWRNHYAHAAARRDMDARLARIRNFRLQLQEIFA